MKLNEKWVVIDGSIFTDKQFPVKTENKLRVVMSRKAVAFNVGESVAKHIVDLHNKSLEKEQPERM